jgi:predicted Zn-dependent protease
MLDSGQITHLTEEDKQDIAQRVYDMMYNDIQEIKQNVYSALSSMSQVSNDVRSEGSQIRSAVSSVHSQLYSIKEVKRY